MMKRMANQRAMDERLHYSTWRKLKTVDVSNFSGLHVVLLVVVLVLIHINVSMGQSSPQDCLGAIPLCQGVYSEVNAFSGEGNVLDEIDAISSCLSSGEMNDVWYTFTVQNSGYISFTIIPNDLSDDYDWAVFNLTNATCAEIYSNNAIEVSCNFSAVNGSTGPNGQSPYNNQDASGTNSNAVIPVQSGEVYVVNVSQYSTSTNGYTIDFTASTATIYDAGPPFVESIQPSYTCDGTVLTVQFNENVLCSSVEPSDFTLTGNGATFPISAITSTTCGNETAYGKTFLFTVNTSMPAAGTYALNIVNTNGAVSDICGNLAMPASTEIYMQPLLTPPPPAVNAVTYCQEDPAVALSAVGTNLLWYTEAVGGIGETIAPIPSTLVPGVMSYWVSQTDMGSGCEGMRAQLDVTVNPKPQVAFSIYPEEATIFEPSIVFEDQTIGAVSSVWDFGDPLSMNNTSVDKSPTHVYSDTGTYHVALTVKTSEGCENRLEKEVHIIFLQTCYVPNSFSPNGDGTNDYFIPQFSIVPKNYELTIYDRWGNLVFKTSNPFEEWNGYSQKKKSQIIERGIYVYKIYYIDHFNEWQEFFGYVNLL